MINIGNEKVEILSTDKNISFGYVGETEVFPNKRLPIIQTEWVDAGLGTWNTTKNSVRLKSHATVVPTVTDGHRLTNLGYFAHDTTGLTTVEYFDTSNVTNFASCFRKCPLLTTVPLLDYSNATNAQSMFQACTNLVTIGEMHTPKLRNIVSMFAECHSLINPPYMDASHIVDMSEVFWKCYSLVETPMVDTKNVEKTWRLFEGCGSLKYVPTYDLSSCRDAAAMFKDCGSLELLPPFNLSNVEIAFSLFENCKSATNTLIHYDFTNMVNAEKMFNMCGKISGDIILDNCDKLKKILELFRNCGSIKTVSFNTISGEILPTTIANCFARAYNLTNINGVINMENITNAKDMFISCGSLVEVRLKNVSCDLTILSENLSYESLEYLFTNMKDLSQEETKYLTLSQNTINNITSELWDLINPKNWSIITP